MKISCPRPLDDGTIFGLPDRIQTYDLRFRRALLYSAELLEDMLYGCFAVSKHYHRTRVDFDSVFRLTLSLNANWVGTPYRL